MWRRNMVLGGSVFALLLAIAPAAMAADPGGTGIAIDPHGPKTPASLGYTQSYVDQKAAAAAGSIERTKAAEGVVAASIASDYIRGWLTIHQKTKYNCLPALGQSVLTNNFGTEYLEPSVAGKQGTSSKASGTITKGMGTTTSGTDDYKAFAWINSEFKRHGNNWHWAAWQSANETEFKNHIQFDIHSYKQLMYVRVDLTDVNYAWHQTTPAQHATGAVAYGTDVTTVDIADPFTHVSGSTCVATPYTATPDIGCAWGNFSTHRYYLARDSVRGGEKAEFF